MMTEGARHDSVTASFAMHRATQRLGIDAACFDAAHDATAFYQMAHDRWRTQVFIPLNTTNEGNYQQIPMEKISQQGIPICREGHDMYFSGYCKDLDRVKWRCPIKATKAGKSLGCECLCSSSTYGRVVYTHRKDNLRLYPKTPRNSLIPVPDLKATNSFSRISDSGDLLRISSRLIQIWYNMESLL